MSQESSSQIQSGQPSPTNKDKYRIPKIDNLTEVSKMEVSDNIGKIEEFVVASAILEEKQAKFQAWISGDIAIPKEHTCRRETPGLAPGYKFSAKVRAKAESLSRENDIATLKLYLEDITNNALPMLESDMQTAIDSCKKKISSNVEEDQATAAVREFLKQAAALKLQGASLLKKRRPEKKRKHEPESTRPNKKRRSNNHHQHHRGPRTWQQPKHQGHRR